MINIKKPVVKVTITAHTDEFTPKIGKQKSVKVVHYCYKLLKWAATLISIRTCIFVPPGPIF